MTQDTTTEKLLACVHRYRVMVQDVVRNKYWNNLWWMHRLDRAYAQMEEVGVAWDRDHGFEPQTSQSIPGDQFDLRKCAACQKTGGMS